MAGESRPGVARCWTFHLTGGDPVTLEAPAPPNLPRHHHEGGMSIWTLLLTSEEVLDVCALLDEVGVPYTYFEQENVELDTPGELVYPTQACESCFWLDPKSKGLCGYREWESAVVQDALDLHEKARQDAKDCPLNE